MELAERLLAGDRRALARAITQAERNDAALRELLSAVRGSAGRAHVVGVTGPPGGGKSTINDLLIERWRGQGRTVAVLAVDPSSPYSGGAILGDRVRMQRHTMDPGVFIRSMASRGHLGGLAAASRNAVRIVDAAGLDVCVLETVGVGQSELEVVTTADTVVLVITPGSGDGVQMIKAGIMEIPDVFVVNKADMPGADRVVKELRALVHEATHRDSRRPDGGTGEPWEPPVLRCVASEGEGVEAVAEAIDRHFEYQRSGGGLVRRRAERVRAEVESIAADTAARRVRRALSEGVPGVGPDGDLGAVDPYAIAARILASGTV
ncbi:MAG TPA: methylmalonyl Co-A mutase-associated GTPase MeaB [Candidatus Dormibacteraeota bacterium]